MPIKRIKIGERLISIRADKGIYSDYEYSYKLFEESKDILGNKYWKEVDPDKIAEYLDYLAVELQYRRNFGFRP